MLDRIRSLLSSKLQAATAGSKPAEHRTGRGALDPRRQWQEQAQEGELDFHRNDEWRPSEDFMRQTNALFASFDFDPQAWSGKTVVDLGAGSRLRTKYFEGANLIAVEPLGDRFVAEIPWSDLGDASALYSRPAEERIDELAGTVDLLVSINVLDHCFDVGSILRNVRDYLKPNGLAFLSFDRHETPDDMHPLVLTEEVCGEAFESAGLEVLKVSRGASGLAGNSQTYGHGEYALNYWLRAHPSCGPGAQSGPGGG